MNELGLDHDGDDFDRAMSARFPASREYRPSLFLPDRAGDRRALADLLRSGAVTSVVDDLENQEREYFQLSHPEWLHADDFASRFATHQARLQQQAPASRRGCWVFFPWLATLVHILDHDQYFAVRTSRNLGLITTEEQRRFYDATVGIVGLSIGNSVALAIVLSGEPAGSGWRTLIGSRCPTPTGSAPASRISASRRW